MRFLDATYGTALSAVNADGSPALPAGEPVYHARLRRATAPKAVPLHSLRRWRWDVRPDPRTTSQRTSFGYTFTRAGALRNIGARISEGGGQ